MKKLLIASMLAAFGAAVILPVFSSDDAVAAMTKKAKTKTEKPAKKKPTG